MAEQEQNRGDFFDHGRLENEKAETFSQPRWLSSLHSLAARYAKTTEIRPELTLLRSQGDAALSRVSPAEPWVRLTGNNP